MDRSVFLHEGPSILTLQESELSKKRKKCESLEQEARKKQRRCEELVSSQGLLEASSSLPPASQVVGSLGSAFIPLSLLFCTALLSWLMQIPHGGGGPCLGGQGPLHGEGKNVGAGPSLPPRAPLVSQELQLREAQNENARLVEENSRLSGRATEKEQVAALPRCCGAWAPTRALVPGQGPAPPPPPTGLEYKGFYSLWGRSWWDKAHMPSALPLPVSRWSGRMRS